LKPIGCLKAVNAASRGVYRYGRALTLQGDGKNAKLRDDLVGLGLHGSFCHLTKDTPDRQPKTRQKSQGKRNRAGTEKRVFTLPRNLAIHAHAVLQGEKILELIGS
jgi:hypothetical protein